MEVLKAIYERRSIRRFRRDPVPREIIERLLDAACQAPSAKNTQPWHFVVFDGQRRVELLSVIRTAIDHEEKTRQIVADAMISLEVMVQAPVIILVFNGESLSYANISEELPSMVDVLSIGASIQNILLAAIANGLGTLWICDVLVAQDKIHKFLGRNEELIAAVAIGYADENPPRRPRRSPEETITWVE